MRPTVWTNVNFPLTIPPEQGRAARWMSAVATEPLVQTLLGDVGQKLAILLGATALMLLIACVNVANLMLSRSESRRRDMALRTVLGASKLRLVRQLLMESLVLAAAGSAVGLVFASAATRAAVGFGPADVPRLDSVALDRTVLAATMALTAVTALLFGLAPALRLLGGNLVSPLSEGSKSTSGPRTQCPGEPTRSGSAWLWAQAAARSCA